MRASIGVQKGRRPRQPKRVGVGVKRWHEKKGVQESSVDGKSQMSNFQSPSMGGGRAPSIPSFQAGLTPSPPAPIQKTFSLSPLTSLAFISCPNNPPPSRPDSRGGGGGVCLFFGYCRRAGRTQPNELPATANINPEAERERPPLRGMIKLQRGRERVPG